MHALAVFQPALPMRGVTLGGDGRLVELLISTRTPHAGSDATLTPIFPTPPISTRTPHAGSDTLTVTATSIQDDFNPHSPCGE